METVALSPQQERGLTLLAVILLQHKNATVVIDLAGIVVTLADGTSLFFDHEGRIRHSKALP